MIYGGKHSMKCVVPSNKVELYSDTATVLTQEDAIASDLVNT